MLAGAGGNICVQLGSIGAVVVDTGNGVLSDKVLEKIRGLTKLPIRYIVNTSADLDHVGGNATLSKAGLTIISGAIGQHGLGEDVITNGGAASILAHENVLQRMSESGGLPDSLWPTKTYSGNLYSMSLNDDGIQIFYEPAAHSDGDSAVLFRKSDVLVAGEIVNLDHFPVINSAKGGSIQGEIDALNRLVDMAIPPFPLVWQEARTYVIPGHGSLMDRIDLVDYRDMVTIVRDIIQDLVKQGKTLEQVKAANPTKAFRPRYGADTGPWTTDMFVEAVYKGLTTKK
jgi:glyoxylase-like metal-dependent hydrolase (beta-lactamase superfamily II)